MESADLIATHTELLSRIEVAENTGVACQSVGELLIQGLQVRLLPGAPTTTATSRAALVTHRSGSTGLQDNVQRPGVGAECVVRSRASAPSCP